MRCAGLVLLVALAGPAVAQGPQKIGVVDTLVLLRDWSRRARFERAVGAERDAIRRELEAQSEGLRRLGRPSGFNRTPYVPGSEEWTRLRDEIRLRSYAFEQECERQQRRLLARVDLLAEALLDDIDLVVREHGQAHGFDLILRCDHSDDAAAPASALLDAARERLRRGRRSEVVFHGGKLNLTHTVLRTLNAEASSERFAARDAELGVPGEPQGALAKPPAWPHLAALTPPEAWLEPPRPGRPERTRWRADVVVRAVAGAAGATGPVTSLRITDDLQRDLEVHLPPLPASGPHTWAVRDGARVRLELFRRKDGTRVGTAVAVRDAATGRLLLFYDDGVCPPVGVEDTDDITTTLTRLPSRSPLDPAPPEDAWEATTLRIDRGNDSVTLRDDEPPALLGRSGLVARVVRARIHSGLANPLAREQVGAWLVWRPAE